MLAALSIEQLGGYKALLLLSVPALTTADAVIESR